MTAEHRARYERHRRKEQLLGRPRLISAVGTGRRVEALMAIGWSSDDLAVKMGYTDGQAVRKFRKASFIQRSTAERFARVYEQLADTPGPSRRVVLIAQAAGMLAPLWWDDDTIDDPTYVPPLFDGPRGPDDVDPVIVDRLVDGTHTDRCTPSERLHAFLRLRDAGFGRAEIAERLRMSWSRVAELEERADARGITADEEAA